MEPARSLASARVCSIHGTMRSTAIANLKLRFQLHSGGDADDQCHQPPHGRRSSPEPNHPESLWSTIRNRFISFSRQSMK